MFERPEKGLNVDSSPFSRRTHSLNGDASRLAGSPRECAIQTCAHLTAAIVMHPHRPEPVTQLCSRHAKNAVEAEALVVEA